MLGVQSLGPIAPRRVAEEAVPVTSSGRGAEPGGAVLEGCVPIHGRAASAVDGAGSHPAADAAATGAAGSIARMPGSEADMERDAWVVLLSISGLGPVSFAALLAAFGSAGAVLRAATDAAGPGRLVQALADAAADAARDPEAGSAGVIFDVCAAGAEAGDQPSASGAPARRRPVIGAELAARICDAATGGSRTVEQVRALGLTVITLEEPCYPERLRLVDLPPPLLFVRGSTAALSASNAVAVVGTRRATDRGRLIAGWIGSAVARAGAAVISGLAVGIDGAAHAAVVAEGGQTVAVLGGGHARLFPKAHERLADAIVESGGAVVSELTPETVPSRGTFPRRNRLVSGLSDATVVVEAGRRSGALITAGWALEQGRDCFLVPGPLDAPASAGCHAFLRSFPGQARIVAGIAELLEDLGLAGCGASSVRGPGVEGARGSLGAGAALVATAPDHPGRAASSSTTGPARAAVLASLGPVELALAEQLGRGPVTADQLAVRTSLAGASVLSALTLLELRGLVKCAYGRYWPSGSLAGWPGSGPKRSG